MDDIELRARKLKLDSIAAPVTTGIPKTWQWVAHCCGARYSKDKNPIGVHLYTSKSPTSEFHTYLEDGFLNEAVSVPIGDAYVHMLFAIKEKTREALYDTNSRVAERTNEGDLYHIYMSGFNMSTTLKVGDALAKHAQDASFGGYYCSITEPFDVKQKIRNILSGKYFIAIASKRLYEHNPNLIKPENLDPAFEVVYTSPEFYNKYHGRKDNDLQLFVMRGK